MPKYAALIYNPADLDGHHNPAILTEYGVFMKAWGRSLICLSWINDLPQPGESGNAPRHYGRGGRITCPTDDSPIRLE